MVPSMRARMAGRTDGDVRLVLLGAAVDRLPQYHRVPDGDAPIPTKGAIATNTHQRPSEVFLISTAALLLPDAQEGETLKPEK
ncbi:MAG: hypothetical protein ACLSB9_33850 [Hydrogeniiclostridium mannosilyticum]